MDVMELCPGYWCSMVACGRDQDWTRQGACLALHGEWIKKIGWDVTRVRSSLWQVPRLRRLIEGWSFSVCSADVGGAR